MISTSYIVVQKSRALPCTTIWQEVKSTATIENGVHGSPIVVHELVHNDFNSLARSANEVHGVLSLFQMGKALRSGGVHLGAPPLGGPRAPHAARFRELFSCRGFQKELWPRLSGAVEKS